MIVLVALVANLVVSFVAFLAVDLARVRGLLICRTGSLITYAAGVAADVGWLLVLAWQVGPFPAAVSSFVVAWSARRTWLETVAPHRHHDEDCEYGPRRRRSTGRVRLTWRKVAVRPAFGAS